MTKRRLLAWLLLGIVLLALLPLASSFLRLRGRLSRALESQWGRTVELDRVEVNLLPRPSLRAFGVRIGEAEPFGAEPFIHAEQARCRPKLAALSRGRIACAELHLVRPSLNLVRSPEGSWNLALWARPIAEGWPALSAEGGRINFKEGYEKRVHALTDARFSLRAAPDGWRLSLEAQPFRSDRRLTEIGPGKLTAVFRPNPEAASGQLLEGSLEIGPGSLSQWIAFLTGQESPLRAQLSLRGTLKGTSEQFSVSGDFSLQDVRSWDLIPARPVPRYRGEFQVSFSRPAHTLEVVRLRVTTEASQLDVRGHVADVFGARQWALVADSPALSLAELLAQYSAVKAGVAPQVRLEGTARLAAQLVGSLDRWQAALVLDQSARLNIPGIRQPLRLESGEVRWEGGRLASSMFRLLFPSGQLLEARARLTPRNARWNARIEVRTSEVSLQQLTAAARALGWNLWGESEWRGAAQFDLQWHGDLGGWQNRRRQGTLELRDVSFRPFLLNRLLQIDSARVEYDGLAVRISSLAARLGKANLAGHLERLRPDSPWTFELTLDRFSLHELDALLNPARARGILTTLLGSTVPPSQGWERLHARGHLQIPALAAGPFDLADVQADLEWKERQLVFRQLHFRLLAGRFRGRFRGDFRRSPPRYHLAGNLRQVEVERLLASDSVRGGSLAVNVNLETAGYGLSDFRRHLSGVVAGVVTETALTRINLLGALRAAARLSPEESDNLPETLIHSLAGEFRLANQRARCEDARMVVDTFGLELSGEVDFEGRLNLRLRGQPLLVAGLQPTPAQRALFASLYEIRGRWREPVVRLAPASPR